MLWNLFRLSTNFSDFPTTNFPSFPRTVSIGPSQRLSLVRAGGSGVTLKVFSFSLQPTCPQPRISLLWDVRGPSS